MANHAEPWDSSRSKETHSRQNKGKTNILRQKIALILLCFLSSGSAFPWEFNNTCKEDHLEYGTRCDDEFQKILDENSIIIDNRTGIN